jgi:NTE family protein
MTFRVGLALGGGAARALSHIGVIEGLEAHGIRVDIVTGTSMGAVIGSLYAAQGDVGAVRRQIEGYLASEPFQRSRLAFMRDKDSQEGEGVFWRFSQFSRKTYFYWMSIARRAFVPEETARQNFELLVKKGRIEDLKLPFVAVALDLVSGREVLLDRGEMLPAMMATCALPGILHPVEIEGQLLVDGGWINAVPVEPAIGLGADFVIGVDVSRRLSEFEEPASGLDIVFRCDAISRYALSAEKLRRADVVLTPEVWHLHWADFSNAEEVIRLGRQEVEKNIGQIRSALRKAHLRSLFRYRRPRSRFELSK